jgi:RNA polymerase-binding transcription factor DksA
MSSSSANRSTSVAPAHGPYEAAAMARIQAELSERGAALERRLHLLNTELPGAVRDGPVAPGDSELIRLQFEHTRLALAAVDDAMDRMARGVYGRCATCEEQIPIERLEAMPEAVSCMRCSGT